jgi:hypothetical protein
MAWLSTVFFFLITGMGFYYLSAGNNTYVLKDALDKRDKFIVDGNQYLFLLIMATGIAACGEWMASRLLMNIIIVLLAFFTSRDRPVFNWTTTAYFLFLFWLLIEIYLSPVKDFGFRVFLKYLFPIMIMLYASKITTSARFFVKVMYLVLAIGLFALLWFLLLGRIPIVHGIISTFIFWGPGILDFFPVTITIAFAMYTQTKKKKFLLYVLLFAVPSILMANRTGLLSASITIIVFSIVRYGIKSLPYVVIGAGISIGTVLYVPSFRQKMFKKQLTSEEIIEQRGSMTSDDINSNGRFAMWEWSKKQYFEGHELMGCGLGVLQERFYSQKHPFVPIRIVHNDYLQLMCDTGWIGLYLYISIMVSLVVHSMIVYFNRRKAFIVRFAALIAGVSMAGMASTLYTDNVVNYTLMTLTYPYAFYGMMIGLNRHYSNPSN